VEFDRARRRAFALLCVGHGLLELPGVGAQRVRDLFIGFG